MRDFHIFYQRIAEVHNRADWKTPFAHIEQEQENDPLPQEIHLKSENAIDAEEKLQNSMHVEENIFDSGLCEYTKNKFLLCTTNKF